MSFRPSHLVLLLLTLLLAACAPDDVEEAVEATVVPTPAPVSQAQALVDQAIAAHGSDRLRRAVVEFDFRDKHFKITRNDGLFSYERTYTEDGNSVREVLNNDGIYREINGERVRLSARETNSLATPLNSVPYFALLPFNLNDPAVQKNYLGEVEIEDQPYHKIEVTFRQEGGGRDYEDRFIYWFHKDEHSMDYMAYDFHTGDGGTRFRQAFNVRTVGGVRFADYHNFISDTLPGPGTPIERYDALFQNGEVELLSEIILDNVTVRPLEAE